VQPKLRLKGIRLKLIYLVQQKAKLKMRMSHMILVIVIFSLLIACNPSESKLTGIYIASENSNSIDSLHLFHDNTYRHVIYSTANKSFIHSQTGKWSYGKGFIDLYSFYDNDNKLYQNEKEYNFEQNYILVNTPVNSLFGKIVIDINSDMGNIYEKIKDE
jgi:hypothetical protein